MNKTVRLILITALLSLVAAGCASTYKKDAEEKRDEVSGKMSRGLKACKGRMTKTGLTQQAGLPTASQHRQDGGEQLVYEYTDQTTITTKDQIVTLEGKSYNWGGGGTNTYNFKMVVTIGFGQNGIMDDWSFRGHTGHFPDNPFTHLRPPAGKPKTAQPAKTPYPSFEETKAKMAASLNAARNSNRVFQADILRQAGEPASKTPNDIKGETWEYRYERIGLAGSPLLMSVNIIFDSQGKLSSYSGTGNLGGFPTNPFTSLKIPEAPIPEIKTKRPSPRGVWVVSADSPGVKVLFDSFPEDGQYILWKGPTLEGRAHGRGIVMVFNRTGEDLGAYVGTFKEGTPGADIECVINEGLRMDLPTMNLRGIPWK